MTISRRDKRALVLLAVATVLFLVIHFVPSGGAPVVVVDPTTSITQAEIRLKRVRQLTASAPAEEAERRRVAAELAEREKGLLQADTAAQAQAQLLQILRRIGRDQAPPLDIRAVEIGQVRPLGEDYGEALVSVSFNCPIEQLVNLLADLTAQPEIVASNELRVGIADPKKKVLSVHMAVSGVVPRRLVPERKGLGSF